jgi:hypothetical protein
MTEQKKLVKQKACWRTDLVDLLVLARELASPHALELRVRGYRDSPRSVVISSRRLTHENCDEKGITLT